MSWLTGAAVALAVLAAWGPRGRPVGRVAGGPSGSVSTPRDRRGAVAPGGRWRARVRAGRSGGVPDLAVVVTDVASRLRAGADPRSAWEAVLGRPVSLTGLAVVDLCGDDRSRTGIDTAAAHAAAAVMAADRLAADLGAPLAPLLDGVAEQLAAQAEAESERRAALAGPRATAQVLTWLPVLGVLLGVAVGADPFAVLLDGSVGSAALAAGVALVLTGRAWTGRLARRAAAAGGAP